MIDELLKSCVAALKLALKKCETMSDFCKSSCNVAIVACESAIENTSAGNCQVAWDEVQEVGGCLSQYKDDACKAAEVACAACSVACRQVVYRSEKNRMFRYIRLDKGRIDRKARTVPLSFSSEYPAMQRADSSLSDSMRTAAGLKDGELYVEVLDHDPDNVDLSLLKNRGAFLDEHDDKDQLGVIEEAEIDGKERIGRAVVKLDTHEKAETRLGQMESDSRPHISAGYKYTRYIGEDTLPNGRKAKRFAWKALEISSVAIPADATIGVARSYQDLPQVDSPKQTNADEPAPKIMSEIVINENEIRERAATTERTRCQEISKIADQLITDHGEMDGGEMKSRIRSMATESIGNSKCNVGDFQVRAMQDVLKAKPAKAVTLEDCTDEEGVKNYSLRKAIQSALKRKEDGKSAIPDGLEGEVHQAMARKMTDSGYEAQGFHVPANAPLRLGRSAGRRMTRDMLATQFASGGAFVPTNLIVPIIELLRNMSILDKLGIRQMAGLSGNIVIPRQEAAATAYTVSEVAALTASQQILGQIALNPKRVGATQTYSRQFVMQSSPDAEAFMRDDLFKVIALAWDYLGLNGQGAAGEPLGVINTPGVGAVGLGGITPTYGKMVDMETALTSLNVTGPFAYVSTPAVRGSLKKVAVALSGATVIGGTQNAIWTGGMEDGEVNSTPAHATNQVPNQRMLIGEWSQLIHAIWGGLDLVVDIFTKAGNAETVITINTWGDFAVRHPQAFCITDGPANL